ncbi:MAG: hypothetical protein QOE76_1804 [Frankiales bacterium]|jgi:hypothetical protein|nr:hypothetical protein [Frankiales bacterium]
MAETLIVGFLVILGVLVWGAGASLYSPQMMSAIVHWGDQLRERRCGPRPFGMPIEQLAADLRRLLAEHDRLTRSKAEWQRAHHLKACELALHDRAEEAATALGLPAYAVPGDCWTTVDLGRRLRQLAEAGLVLPENAGMDGDRI